MLRDANKAMAIFAWIVKLVLLLSAVLLCFAATIPAVALMARLLPDAPVLVHFLVAIPLLVLANRFMISPLEYHLDIKSLQYDPWYENRRRRKNSRPAGPGKTAKPRH